MITDSSPVYLGPLPDGAPKGQLRVPLWRRVPIAFVLVVVLPTLLAGLYFLVMAAPQYVSEARFIVRAPSQKQPSSFGMALEGVGLSATQTDAFAVHEFIASRDGLRDLQTKMDAREAWARRGLDFFSGYPAPFGGRTFEDLYHVFSDAVVVGYDSTTGISTLRVRAYTPTDAQRIAGLLMSGGEGLVNDLNTRAADDTISAAAEQVREAEARLSAAQISLTQFRNREQIIDPARTANAGSEMIGELMTTLANLRAERSQIASETPMSPQLSAIDSRIGAYERQIAAEQAKLAGSSRSLALMIGSYESLELNRDFAGRALTTATLALDNARIEARRQQLYLERVVSPSLPDKSTYPRRFISILAVFLSTLLIYGIGWLVWAGVHEHRQAG